MLKFNTRLWTFFVPLLKYGICYLDLGSNAPPPDPLIGQAAEANTGIAREVWDTTRSEYERSAPMRAEAEQIALSQARGAAATAADQRQRDTETYGYTRDTFRPLEQRIATDALGYNTPQRQEQEAGQAVADVGSGIDAQQQQLMRQQASMGVDPSSNASLALARRGAVMGGALKAAAGNQARKNVEAIGSAKLADAAALGRGISAGNATQTQLGLQAGSNATGNAGAAGGITGQGLSMMNQGASTGISGNSSAGNLALGGYNAQLQADRQSQTDLGGLANLGMAGAKLFAMSDKTIKKDRKKTNPAKSLKGLRDTPVETWKYKLGSKADDGGKTHTGAMAQDVQKNFGNKTAPDGKVIDIVSMIGHTMNAVKALDKQVQGLSAARKGAK